MGRKKNNQLVQHNHHHQQISSFNLACCLWPPPPPPALVDADKSRSWLPFLCHFSTPGSTEVDSRRTTPQLIKSSTLTSSASSSSQLLELDVDGEGPASPEVGCMGQVRRRSDVGKRPLQSRRFSRTSVSKSAKVEDYCSSGRREAEYAAETMDPPLPVPKREVAAAVVVVDSLWKRRHGTGDASLERLNVQQLKLQQTHAAASSSRLQLHSRFRGLDS